MPQLRPRRRATVLGRRQESDGAPGRMSPLPALRGDLASIGQWNQPGRVDPPCRVNQLDRPSSGLRVGAVPFLADPGSARHGFQSQAGTHLRRRTGDATPPEKMTPEGVRSMS